MSEFGPGLIFIHLPYLQIVVIQKLDDRLTSEWHSMRPNPVDIFYNYKPNATELYRTQYDCIWLNCRLEIGRTSDYRKAPNSKWKLLDGEYAQFFVLPVRGPSFDRSWALS